MLYSVFLFFSVLFLYLSFLSKLYNFDGVACAMAIELGNLKHLFHGNHLLYGFLGFLFHHLLHSIGLNVRSIISLQLMNCVLGSFSSVLFFLLLYRLTRQLQLSILYALGMVFSFGFWLWHLEAQVYPLGFIFLVSATFVLFSQDHSKKYVWVGLLHSLACLGHIVHIIWIPVVLHRMYVETNSVSLALFWQKVRHYMTSLFIPLLCAYGAVILLVIKPQTVDDGMRFLSGSAALSGTFSWPGLPGFERIKIWLFTEGQALYGHDLHKTVWGPATSIMPTLLGGILRLLSKVLLAGAGIYGLLKIKNIFVHDNKPVLIECGIWIGVYALFFSSWEPGNITYHQTDLIPLWIVIAFIFKSMPGSLVKLGAAAIVVIVLFINNFYGVIYPLSKASRNPLLSKMKFINEISNPQDLIIITGGWGRVYVPYFSRRRYVTLEHHRKILAETATQFWEKGLRVFVYSDILENDTLKQLGLFYTIKINYRKDENFSLAEIVPINESKY